VTGGGRLVLTLLPGQSPGRLLAEKPETQPADLAERWGLAWSTHDKPPGPGDQAVPADTNAGPAAAVPWHGRVYFDRLSPRWKAPWLYRGKPAIVERPLGAGTVVAAADSYFASNEALRAHRRAGLLVWAVGPDRRAIFDETHLGVHDEPGIVMLARRYGLAWMLPALAVLAALFVWKNATSLVPRRPAGRDEQAVRVEGRDSSAGLVNLLRRAVPAGQLLRVCFERWSRRLPPERKDLAAKAARMARIVEREEKLPRRRRDPAAAYREMAKVLNERA